LAIKERQGAIGSGEDTFRLPDRSLRETGLVFVEVPTLFRLIAGEGSGAAGSVASFHDLKRTEKLSDDGKPEVSVFRYFSNIKAVRYHKGNARQLNLRLIVYMLKSRLGTGRQCVSLYGAGMYEEEELKRKCSTNALKTHLVGLIHSTHNQKNKNKKNTHNIWIYHLGKRGIYFEMRPTNTQRKACKRRTRD